MSLRSITIAPTHGAPLERLEQATIVEGSGIVGDRCAGTTRQVTLVATGEIDSASEAFGAPIDPGGTRRNLVIEADTLPRTHGARIVIGEVELTVWRDCAPCEVMDAVFGPGARTALAGRAGVSARVLRGGVIRVGDPVTILDV